MKPNLIINGAAGRMGKRVIALAMEQKEFDMTAAVENKSHPDIGKDVGVLAGIGEINLELQNDFPATADVLVDFSLPDAADKVIEYCAGNNVSLVMATTGLTKGQLEKLKNASKKIAIVHASNFSVGMNLLFSLVGKAAKTLGDEYDIEIIEAHHRFKKDAPSGTAITLAQKIAEGTGRRYPDCMIHGRQGKDALRKKDTIGIHAIRAGDIVGEHSVIMAALGETVTLSHSAHTRDTFARGALRAAGWLIGKQPGLYSMTDVLGM